MSLFSLKNVSARYGAREVLRHISLSISDGEFIAVIGPNGAGKSTLVKLLHGALKPAAGGVLFRGSPIGSYSRRELARSFALLHQDNEAPLPYTVYEYLMMGRFPHQSLLEIETPADRERASRALAMTGITQLAERRLDRLSGGEFRLASIARALAQNDRLLILDEPVANLDMKHRVEVMDILHSLNREGATIITVLHDINLASDYTTRIIALKGGELFFDGSPNAVLNYTAVEELFDTGCIVLPNPTSGRPFVYPVPGYVKRG